MFSSETPEQPQSGITPLGINESTTSTAAQARPLPVFWGTQKLGLTYISNAFNQEHTDQTQDTGKSDIVVGHYYTCQFAALVCHGPVDAIHQIRYNDKQIWPNPASPDEKFRGSDDFVDFQVEGTYFTSWRIYWGTETQEIDCPPELEPVSCTATASTDMFVGAPDGLTNGDAIRITGTTMPGGLSSRLTYYAVNVETVDSVTTFQVASTSSGAALDITSNGSGLTVRKLHSAAHVKPFFLSDLAETWWTGAAEFHPAYKGQCYIVGRMHALGYQTTTFPQIEVIVSRWPGGLGKVGTTGKQDMLVPVIVKDCVTNARYGLGLPDTSIDTTTYDATNVQLATETLGISPFLDRAQAFNDFLTDMNGYTDGYIYATPAGKIAFGLNRGVECSAAALPCTANAITDTFACVSHGLVDGVEITISGTKMPNGLNSGQTYYVVNASANAFKISATESGAAINFTTNGSELYAHKIRVWLDETCLAELPKIYIGTINATRNEVQVQFTNQDIAYKSDCCMGHSSGSLAMLGSPSSQALDRPWVTRIALADKMARAAVKIMSLPTVKGTLTVRKSRLQGLTIGSPFYYSYRLHDLCTMHCVVNSVRVSDPFAPSVEIDFSQDHGYLNGEEYNPPAYVAPSVPTITAPKITECLCIEAPASKFDPQSGLPCFLVLASRPNVTDGKYIGGMVVQYLDGVTPHLASAVASVSTYQPRLELLDNVDLSQTTISVRVLSQWDALPNLIAGEYTIPPDGVLEWLLIWTCTDGTIAEIMSLTGTHATGVNEYTLTVRRGAMDVPPQIIPTTQPGLTGWVFSADALNLLKFTVPLTLAIGDQLPVVIMSRVGMATGPASDTMLATYRDRTYRPWKPYYDWAEWPSAWEDSDTQMVFSWVCRWKTDRKPSNVGPRWVIDIRPTSYGFSILDPSNGAVFQQSGVSDETSMTVKVSDLIDVLITRQAITIRLFAFEDDAAATGTGRASLWFDEKELTAP